MGMGLTQSEIEQALANPANQPRLPAQQLERFDAGKLALLLEQEVGRATEAGLSHVSLNMNLVDTVALARALRRASLIGE